MCFLEIDEAEIGLFRLSQRHASSCYGRQGGRSRLLRVSRAIFEFDTGLLTCSLQMELA